MKTASCVTAAAAFAIAASSVFVVRDASAASPALPPLTGGGPALTASNYDTTVTSSYDGAKIAITVMVPKVAANTPVPLIVHSNPWAGKKLESPSGQGDGIVAKIAFTQADTGVAELANANGYYIISYDERGWGGTLNGSGGTDEFMDPAINGQDFISVLNWAEANLGPQLARRNGKMVVGLTGYSYGGGFQLMGASLDDRVSVMVPALTWYSLITSLAPGLPDPQPKSAWASLLSLSGQLFSKANPVLVAGAKSAKQTGDAPTDLLSLAQTHGSNSYCESPSTAIPGQKIPVIPTFLVQGWYDTLFNANQAVQTAACLRNAGADVRLLIQQLGHTLPADSVAGPSPVLLAGIQNSINCGSQTFDIADAMYSFIDEKIRGTGKELGPHVEIPTNCVTLDDSVGVVLNAIPFGGTSYSLPITTVSGDTFVPIYTATGGEHIAGIPHMKVSISSTASTTPYAYIGFGIKTGSGSAKLLGEQVFPIHGSGTFDTDMIGVAANLKKGDVIGVWASNSNSQYAYSSSESKKPPTYTISGSFAVPFLN